MLMGVQTAIFTCKPCWHRCYQPQRNSINWIIFWVFSLCSCMMVLSSSEETESSVLATSTTKCPASCHCTNNNTNTWCLSSGLTWIPSLPLATHSLVMHNNHIQHVYNYSFYGLVGLEILDLEDNQILNLAPEALFGLYRLRVLKLGNNNIAQLPKNIFRDNRFLELLDLHGNYFSSVPDYALTNLASLRLLNMSVNHLNEAMLGSGFAHTPNIETLDFSWNYFSKLNLHAFQASLWWTGSSYHNLNLSYCNIRHINKYAFRELYKYVSLSLEGNTQIVASELIEALQELEGTSLRTLIMSNMNISDVHSLFERFQHKTLEFLDLSRNVIKDIPMRTFYYLTQLKRLDLSGNSLTSVGDFSGLSRLEELILSHNTINSIRNTNFEGLQVLKTLDLSHNRLVIENDAAFSDLWDLSSLDISYNNISHFRVISGLENLQCLYIRHNHLSSLGSVSKLLRLRELDVSENEIREIQADFFPKDQSPVRVNFSHNHISTLGSGLFQAPSPEVIDLSHNWLTQIDLLGWGPTVRVLNVCGNRLHSVGDHMLQGLSSLQELDLSRNNIDSLSPAAFAQQGALRKLTLSKNPIGGFLQTEQGSQIMSHLFTLTSLVMSDVQFSHVPRHMLSNLTSLTALDLSRNNITDVSPQDFYTVSKLTFLDLSFNQISILDPHALTAIASLQVLDLSGNPYFCACELMPFRNWLVSTKLTLANIQGGSYVCASPPEWRGIDVASFHLQSQECSHLEMAVILTAASCIMLAIIITTVGTLYRYRWFKRKVRNTQYSVIEDGANVQNTSLTENHMMGTSRVWV